jgi:hypothetical protein
MAVRSLLRKANSSSQARQAAKAVRSVTKVQHDYLFEAGDLVEFLYFEGGKHGWKSGIVTGLSPDMKGCFLVIFGGEQIVVHGQAIRQALSR